MKITTPYRLKDLTRHIKICSLARQFLFEQLLTSLSSKHSGVSAECSMNCKINVWAASRTLFFWSPILLITEGSTTTKLQMKLNKMN